MKLSKSLVLTVIGLCLGRTFDTEAQRRKKQRTFEVLTLRGDSPLNSHIAAQKPSQALGRLAGAWNVMVSPDTPYGYSVIEGDETKIEGSVPSTISFRTTVARGPFGQSSQYTFNSTLKYDSSSQTYLISVLRRNRICRHSHPNHRRQGGDFRGQDSIQQRQRGGAKAATSGRSVK